MAVIAIDLGGTKLAAAIFRSNGRMLHRTTVTLGASRGREVGALVRNQITSLLEFAHRRALRINAISVAVPGIVNAKNGTVWAPNIAGWKKYPLRREIQKALRARCSVPMRSPVRLRQRSTAKPVSVLIESDRACYILGEAWRGAAKGCRNAIFLAVGTGVGAGIIVDGHVLRGAHGIAGAVGWLALDRQFRTEYSKYGCFEFNASGDGLVKCAKHWRRSNRKSSVTPSLHHPRPVSSPDLFAAYNRHDPVAQLVIRQAIEFWGMAVANLVSIFNPEKVIFGGGVFGPARRFLPEIRTEAKKWAQPISMKRVKIQSSTLGSEAGLYGAAFLALKS